MEIIITLRDLDLIHGLLLINYLTKNAFLEGIFKFNYKTIFNLMKNLILIVCFLFNAICVHSAQKEDIKSNFPHIQAFMVKVMSANLPNIMNSDKGSKIFKSARVEKYENNGVVTIYSLPDSYDISNKSNLKKAIDYITKKRNSVALSNKDDKDMKALLKADFVIAFRVEHKNKKIKEIKVESPKK